MKKLRFLPLLLMFACSWHFEPIPESAVEPVKKDLASKFAYDYLSSLRDSIQYTNLSAIIPEMAERLIADTNFDMYHQIQEKYGDFDTLRYVEALKQSGADPLEVYRFKGEFTNTEDPIEVRVVINEAYQIGGFAVKPWVAEYQ